nr:hypothetical protein Iba_chr03bCG1830 [Ipomoea batatas]
METSAFAFLSSSRDQGPDELEENGRGVLGQPRRNFHSPVELSNEMNCAPCLFVFNCKFSRIFLDESSIFCFKDLSFSNRVTSAGLLSPIPTAGLELSSS